MVFAILPTYIVDVLGASHTKLGLIEGVAIFLGFAFKVCFGIVSDVFRSRKPFIALGSFLSILVKILFACASSFTWIFLARSIDRLAKGVRSSPTDALIADISPHLGRGKSYGVRQTFYTLGAVAGSLIAYFLLYCNMGPNGYRIIFLLSSIPASIALVILWRSVRQPTIVPEIKPLHAKWQWSDIALLPSSYWMMLVISSVLMCARFSEAFVCLRVRDAGWSVAMIPLLLAAMKLAHALVSYPMGKRADLMDKYRLLALGIGALVVTDIIFLLAQTPWMVFLGVLGAGLHMGMTQGLLATLIATNAPSELRGTAFAIYYMCSGVAVLFGNTVAGHFADLYAPHGAFYSGLIFSGLSVILLLRFMSQKRLVHIA